MTRATGGSAPAATSTRSSPLPYANSSASFVARIPTWPPTSSTSRTRCARISSLIRSSRLRGTCRSRSGLRRRGLKGPSSSSQLPPCKRQKPLHAAAHDFVQPARLNLRESSPGGEEAMSSCLQSGDATTYRGSASSASSKPVEELAHRKGGLLASVLTHGERLVRLA